MLFNLIQNAIRHTPADGSVVGARRAAPATRVEIEVADTGAGSRRRTRERVFEPFFRGGDDGARARRAAPASGWRSRARSSRRTAAASGSSRAAAGTRVRFLLPVG